MSSENDPDLEDIPRKRRKGVEKENLTPSPESQGRHERKRLQSPSQKNHKKARTENLQREILSQPAAGCDVTGTPGKIVRVKLNNFMCHSNFVFTFGDKINFISGKNGSGKSAILTALVLGLGGRTSDTNRGSSLAKLLKNGENKGSIEITISNSGARSHDPGRYGNEITVVRTLTERSSSYKFLSEKGKIVSKRRLELKAILLSFNIQVNNPVSILNQDTARTFLKTATPEELYNLFRKGTLIDEIEEKLKELQGRKLPMIRALLKRKEQANASSVKDLLEYKKLVEQYAELSKNQNEIYDLQKALSWIYVSELEGKLTNTEKEMTVVESKIGKIRQNIESRDGAQQLLRVQMSELEEQLQQWRGESDAIDQANIDLEQKLSYHKGIVKRKIEEIKKKQKKVDTEDRRCAELQSEIDNKRSRDDEIESKTAQILQQRAELRKRCEELKAVISTTEVHKQQLSDTVDETYKRVEFTERYAQNMTRSITQKQEYMKSLASGEKNELSVYSEWMPQFVAEIDVQHRRRSFDSKPKGPIGRFIKLKDKTWGPVVESFIGARLNSFAVCSSRDLATMRRILDRLNIPTERRPTLIVTQFQDSVYDCSSTEVRHPKYKNLFRSIDITDPTVANILLDAVQLDTVLLIPTSEETYPLAQDQANVPRNCVMFLNKDGTRIYPQPSYRCYSNTVAEKTRYLQVSPEQAIRITEHELTNLKQEYSRKTGELVVERKKLNEAKTRLQEFLKELNMLRGQLNKCEAKLFEAEHVELPESIDQNILEEDLQYRKTMIDTLKGEIDVLEREKDQALSSCRSEKAAWTEKEGLKQELNLKMKRIEKDILDVKNQLRDYSTNYDHSKEMLKEEMAKVERYSQKIANLKTELEDALRTAAEMSPERVVSTVSKQDLEQQISRLSQSVKVLEKKVGKKPIKPNDYESRVEKYEQTVVSLQKVSMAMDALNGNYIVLVKRMDSLLNLVVSTTAFSFKKILKKRNFIGEIVINHKNKKLDLNVKPDPTVQADTNITTLSGGERSYSMVAFIMSLWENMATPFYFLDEFDVFMDEMNRRLIMDLLKSHARKNPDKQYVFLTPHAVSDESATDIHYFRMDDPRK